MVHSGACLCTREKKNGSLLLIKHFFTFLYSHLKCMQCVSLPQQEFHDLEDRILLELSNSGFNWQMDRCWELTDKLIWSVLWICAGWLYCFQVCKLLPEKLLILPSFFMKYWKLTVSDKALTALICSERILNVTVGIQHPGKRSFLFCLSKIIYFCNWRNITCVLINELYFYIMTLWMEGALNGWDVKW